MFVLYLPPVSTTRLNFSGYFDINSYSYLYLCSLMLEKIYNSVFKITEVGSKASSM